MAEIVIPVAGMDCGGCVKAVNQALRAMKGVKESTVPAELTSVIAGHLRAPVAALLGDDPWARRW